MRNVFTALILGAWACAACAGVVPEPCEKDSRILCVDYDPNVVYRIEAHVGYETSVFFAPDEHILQNGIGSGFSDAWDLRPIAGGSGFYVKPKNLKPDTNLTIVTTKRTYIFELRMDSPEKKVEPKPEKTGKGRVNWKLHKIEQPEEPAHYVFALRFRYPEDEAKQKLSMAKKHDDRAVIEKELQMADEKNYKNTDYWIRGSEDLAPVSVWDNGMFTFLKFPPNVDLPSIYMVDADGKESLVDKHMEEDMVVVEHVARKLVLRRGALVSAIINHAYDAYGKENGTLTVSPEVVRVIKRGDTQGEGK
ncbi:MAG: P-type conjugative transfer protein VirB9 [Burkholderiales bacterium]